jgi:hypothetical protein
MATASATATALYWNASGQVGCDAPGHAPYRGSDTWRSERWTRMTPRMVAEWTRHAGSPPRCECCAAKR